MALSKEERLKLPNIGLLGRAGAGKDTAAVELRKRYGYVRVAFADPIKEVAFAVDPIVHTQPEPLRLSQVVHNLGWDAAKREFPEVRRLLQRIGLEAGRDVLGPSVWLDIAMDRIRGLNRFNPIVVTDVRFRNEAETLRLAGFALVWIDRPGTEDGDHPSEHELSPQDADHVVTNDGAPDDLYRAIAAAVGL